MPIPAALLLRPGPMPKKHDLADRSGGVMREIGDGEIEDTLTCPI
jgi:hypothetical protein